MDEITTVDQFIDGAVQFKEEPYFTDGKLRKFTQLMLDAQMSGLDIDTDVGIGKTPKMRIWIRHPNFTKADKMGDVQTMAFRAMNGLLNEIFRQRWHIEQLQAEIRKLQQPTPDVTARALVSNVHVHPATCGADCPAFYHDGDCGECQIDYNRIVDEGMPCNFAAVVKRIMKLQKDTTARALELMAFDASRMPHRPWEVVVKPGEDSEKAILRCALEHYEAQSRAEAENKEATK